MAKTPSGSMAVARPKRKATKTKKRSNEASKSVRSLRLAPAAPLVNKAAPIMVTGRDVAMLKDLAAALTQMLHIIIRAKSAQDGTKLDALRVEIEQPIDALAVIRDLALNEWLCSDYAAIPKALHSQAEKVCGAATTIWTMRDAFDVDLQGPLVVGIENILKDCRDACEEIRSFDATAASQPTDRPVAEAAIDGQPNQKPTVGNNHSRATLSWYANEIRNVFKNERRIDNLLPRIRLLVRGAIELGAFDAPQFYEFRDFFDGRHDQKPNHSPALAALFALSWLGQHPAEAQASELTAIEIPRMGLPNRAAFQPHVEAVARIIETTVSNLTVTTKTGSHAGGRGNEVPNSFTVKGVTLLDVADVLVGEKWSEQEDDDHVAERRKYKHQMETNPTMKRNMPAVIGFGPRDVKMFRPDELTDSMEHSPQELLVKFHEIGRASFLEKLKDKANLPTRVQKRRTVSATAITASAATKTGNRVSLQKPGKAR